MAKHRAENAEGIKVKQMARYARNAEAVLAQQATYRSKNVEAVRARNAGYRARNAESIREYGWTQRAQSFNAFDERVEISLLTARDGGVCGYCGVGLEFSLRPGDEKVSHSFELDHILPYSLGGRHNYESVVSSCRRCNQAKRDRHPSAFIDWAKENGYHLCLSPFVSAWLARAARAETA